MNGAVHGGVNGAVSRRRACTTDTHGTHVVQYCIKYGSDEQKARIFEGIILSAIWRALGVALDAGSDSEDSVDEDVAGATDEAAQEYA